MGEVMGLAVKPRSSPPRKEVGLTCSSSSGWGSTRAPQSGGPGAAPLRLGTDSTSQPRPDLKELTTRELSSSHHSHRALCHLGGLP